MKRKLAGMLRRWANQLDPLPKPVVHIKSLSDQDINELMNRMHRVTRQNGIRSL